MICSGSSKVFKIETAVMDSANFKDAVELTVLLKSSTTKSLKHGKFGQVVSFWSILPRATLNT